MGDALTGSGLACLALAGVALCFRWWALDALDGFVARDPLTLAIYVAGAAVVAIVSTCVGVALLLARVFLGAGGG